jgi:predicted outer membrane repeat protein
MSGTVATRATVVLLSEASLSYSNSQAIVFNSLDIIYHEKQRDNLSQSALIFESSQTQIINVKFIGLISNNLKSRGISFIQSRANLLNCSFVNGHSDYGGAISIQNSSTIILSKVDFTNNTATMTGGAIFANNSELTFMGDTLFLQNKIDSSNFQSGFLGGGAISILQSNVLFIDISNFIENGQNLMSIPPISRVDATVFGGAILMVENSMVLIQGEATFNNNCGGSGGAVFSVNSTLSLSGSVKFTNNDATNGFGGAISAYSSSLNYQEEIIFDQNSATSGGAVFIENSILGCLDNITFAYNTARFRGGGVYVVDSKVIVSGQINFMENMAEGDGGGMGLEGFTAQLVLQAPAKFNFYNNTAIFGGALFYLDSNAMYIDQCKPITIEKKPCFFTADVSSDVEIHMNFSENHASAGGAVLYGGALQLCQVLLSDNVYADGKEYLESISTFTNNGRRSSTKFSSNPLKVCFCKDKNIDCSKNMERIQIQRGRQFNVSLVTVGQYDTPATSAVRAATFGYNTTIIPFNHLNSGVCDEVGFQLLTIDDYIMMTLFPDGPCINVSNIHRSIEVIVDACPPGFSLDGDHCECEKKLLELDTSINCDIGTGLIKRPGYSWIQPILDENYSYIGFIFRNECAFDYCKPSQDPVFLNFSADTNDDQCAAHRTGTLCGACKDGYSLTLYNFQCRVCNNRYVSLLLFFGFAGIALIAVLLVLQMTVAAGTINGLILYANIVNICRDIFLPFRNTNVTPLSIFISWVNLDFGIPVCFYDGLDAYTYAWFQFVFPFYLWLLIGIIIFSSKLSTKVGKLLGSNPVAVLATVILMSFTKLLDTTIGVLSHRYLTVYPDGKIYNIVWSYDGNLALFRGKHAVLGVVAICVLVFLLLPYIFLLTFGYRLQAYSGKKGFFWFNRFKPFLDAYYAPYNKRTRYWTGFLLFVRTCLFFTFLLNNVTFNYIAIEVSSIFTAIAVIAWLSNRVYEKLYVDILEASFILNICILTSASFHVQVTNGNQAALTYLSIAIAFVEFIGIIIFHLCLRIKIFQRCRCLKFNILTKMRKSSNETELERHDSTVTTNALDIREPLLEDD